MRQRGTTTRQWISQGDLILSSHNQSHGSELFGLRNNQIYGRHKMSTPFLLNWTNPNNCVVGIVKHSRDPIDDSSEPWLSVLLHKAKDLTAKIP